MRGRAAQHQHHQYHNESDHLYKWNNIVGRILSPSDINYKRHNPYSTLEEKNNLSNSKRTKTD